MLSTLLATQKKNSICAANAINAQFVHFVLSVTDRAQSAEWDCWVWQSWGWRGKPHISESSICTVCRDSQWPSCSKQPVGFFFLSKNMSKYSCRKLMLIFKRDSHFTYLVFFTLCLYQRHPWGRSALQYISGDCHLRDSASSSEPGLQSSEQIPASTGHSGGHGAHLPETHHCQ